MSNILPAPARWVALAGITVAMFLLGALHGERSAGQRHVDYVQAQVARGLVIAKARAQVVVQTEVKYRDRLKTIYVKGEEIEKQVPVFVTAADNAECRVNAGFVRSYNAGWAGEPAGPAASADRDPSGVSLAEVAETNSHNATACLAWRELALGLREYYAKQQVLLK